MKGKKVDRDFLNIFMNECLKNGITSSKDMACSAKDQIETINLKIKEVEELKNLRCKLLDVVSSFEKNEKHISEQDQKILIFYKIKDISISKNICEILIEFNNELPLKELEHKIKKSKHDIFFCIKQLIDIGVLNRHEKILTKGFLFDEYFIFVENR